MQGNFSVKLKAGKQEKRKKESLTRTSKVTIKDKMKHAADSERRHTRRNISTGMGFRLSPLPGLPPDSQLSHSDQRLVPVDDVDERDPRLRTWRSGVEGGEGVVGKALIFNGSLEGERMCERDPELAGDREAKFELSARRERPPNTVLKGLKSVVVPVRLGSTMDPSVLVDQRLRRTGEVPLSHSSLCEELEGVLGNENGEIGLCASEDWDKVSDSMEERGASESVLLRG